jgi:serine/threonine-protein kinase RsbW
MTTPGLVGETWTMVTIPPLLDRLSDVRDFVGARAQVAGLSPERVFDLKVAVSEAGANAIEHGEASDLKVYVRTRPDRLVVEVVGGRGFQLVKGQPHDRADRGMGLPLMIAFADEVSVHRRAEGLMAVLLTFRLKQTDSPAPTLSIWNQGEAPQGARLGRLLSAVLERTPVAMCVLDANLCYTWVNQAYRLTLDEPWRSGAGVIGLPLAQVVPESESKRGTLQVFQEVLETGVPFIDDEYRHEGKDQDPAYWRLEILPFNTAAGGAAISTSRCWW